jgi:hypothetical protein
LVLAIPDKYRLSSIFEAENKITFECQLTNELIDIMVAPCTRVASGATQSLSISSQFSGVVIDRQHPHGRLE